MKKALIDIDGALAAQGATDAPSRPPPKNADTTFGIHKKRDGQLSLGSTARYK